MLASAVPMRDRLTRENLRGVQQIDDRRHARIERGEAHRLGVRARGETGQRELAVAVEPLGKAVAALQELACVREAAVLVFERGE